MRIIPIALFFIFAFSSYASQPSSGASVEECAFSFAKEQLSNQSNNDIQADYSQLANNLKASALENKGYWMEENTLHWFRYAFTTTDNHGSKYYGWFKMYTVFNNKNQRYECSSALSFYDLGPRYILKASNGIILQSMY